MRFRVSSAFGIAIALCASSSWADPQGEDEPADPKAPVIMDDDAAGGDSPDDAPAHDKRAARSASAESFHSGELQLRPRMRPSDLLEVAPGLVTSQHSGGGHANQYALRGVDLDHGTDLLLLVDGVPVNMPSHAHGQGYANINFVIPELISTIDVHMGPYRPRFGDFATTGAIEIGLADHHPESQITFSAGQYGMFRGLGVVSREVGKDWRFVIAGEAYGQDGPYEHADDLQRFNAVARVTADVSSNSSLTFSWMSHGSRWDASGALPVREITAGRLDPFGSVDPTQGGDAQRHAGSLRFRASTSDADINVLVYGMSVTSTQFSNFSYYQQDPLAGDQVQQTDERSVFGLDGRTRFHHHVGPLRLETTFGAQARVDGIDAALHRTVSQERLGTTSDAHINQTGVALYADERVEVFDWLAVHVGIRLDRADASVEDRQDDGLQNGNRGSGTAGATLASPKASVIMSPFRWLDVFANFGRGFHSNDARGAVQVGTPATLLAAGTGYEFGARANPWEPLTVSVAGYRLDLDAEQIYVNETGTTISATASSRLGLETSARFHFDDWLYADASATFNRAYFRANASNGGGVALAPLRTIRGGLGAKFAFGLFASVRVRHVGARPASVDRLIEAEGYTLLDARIGQRYGPAELTLDAQNLLNSDWRDTQFLSSSRLPGEAVPVDDIHATPGWPFTFRASLSAYF